MMFRQILHLTGLCDGFTIIERSSEETVMKRFSACFCGVVVFALTATDAKAGLIGLNINSLLSTQFAGSWSTGDTATVGPGIEFTRDALGATIVLTLDVEDTSFTLNYVNDFPDTGQGAFNLGLLSFDLTGLNSPQGAITNVVLTGSNFGNGLGSATFTSNSITVPITTLIPPGGTNWTATWDITFAGVVAAVPEPDSLTLLAAGAALL